MYGDLYSCLFTKDISSSGQAVRLGKKAMKRF